MTLTEFIANVRRKLHDEAAAEDQQRWTEVDITTSLALRVPELFKSLPEAFYVTTRLSAAPAVGGLDGFHTH